LLSSDGNVSVKKSGKVMFIKNDFEPLDRLDGATEVRLNGIQASIHERIDLNSN